MFKDYYNEYVCYIYVYIYIYVVESVLLYNCGTWALPVSVADELDRAQHKMIRHVLGLKWADKITNADLYVRSGLRPANDQALYARWRLFGHTLRLNENTPARQAMLYYFQRGHDDGRQGNFVHIATCLSREYKSVTDQTITTSKDYRSIQSFATDRDAWKELTSDVVNKYKEQQEAKALKLTEARKARECK